MRIQNKNAKASRRPIKADEELFEEEMDTEVDDFDEGYDEGAEGEGEVTVAPEASELLFEAEDVAELVAEVTGEAVEVEVDEDVVTFAVGDDTFVVEAEGDEEVLESVRKPFRGKKPVRASRRPTARRPVAASRRPAPRTSSDRKPVKASKVIRKVPKLGR